MIGTIVFCCTENVNMESDGEHIYAICNHRVANVLEIRMHILQVISKRNWVLIHFPFATTRFASKKNSFFNCDGMLTLDAKVGRESGMNRQHFPFRLTLTLNM